ncbi:MAG: peptidase U32 family protein [Raoultibacter sp.]|jgi:putative protease
MNRQKPELLAPAGGLEQLSYALHFGADAVYCATDRFGLRQRADNFSLDDISQAVALTHEAGAELFVTCNAYMDSDDLKVLPEYLESLAQSQVDALIVSDLGALRLAKQYAPGIDLHVSTQASCSNTQAALTWYELGAKRVVCAREMSLEAIAGMRQELPEDLEIEVFVHGAMCMAISGRCLISDFVTGRSANKGHCAQSCRWNYALEEETRPGSYFPIEEDGRGSYIMNADDLCMLEHLDELVAAGVDSLKIEGRNKKAFYVATVVNAYRQVLDGAKPQTFLSELDTISHRRYSTGFFFETPSQDTENTENKGQNYDWVAEVLESVSDGRVKVACRNRFYEGDELEVLSPQKPVRLITVANLRLEYSDGQSEAVTTANRAMDTYSIDAPIDLAPQDILRVKRKDPSKKN